jgi:hypothetical protein
MKNNLIIGTVLILSTQIALITFIVITCLKQGMNM